MESGRFYRTLFFFSSRRRQTRYWRDWSSDVCSSDLGQHDRGVARVAVPALPGGGVQHGRHAAVGHALPGPDRGELGAADLDDVLVADADVGEGVAVAARAAGRPDLVVDLAVRVDAGELVAVAVADEDVLHGGHAQQVDVLADVGRVQRDAHGGQ